MSEQPATSIPPAPREPSGDVTFSSGGTRVKFGKTALVAVFTAIFGVGGIGAWNSSSGVQELKSNQAEFKANQATYENRLTKLEWETYWARTEVRAGFERFGVVLGTPAPQQPTTQPKVTQ